MSLNPKTFSEAVRALRFGKLDDEATDAMRRLVLACAATGRNGTLTLKITFRPGKAGQMEVDDAVSIKEPQAERGRSLLFATPEGNLQRNDPRQMQIEGRTVVDRTTGEIIDVHAKESAA